MLKNLDKAIETARQGSDGCRAEYERLLALKADNTKLSLTNINEALAITEQVFEVIEAALEKLNKIIFNTRYEVRLQAEARVRDATKILDECHLLLNELKLKLDRVNVNSDFIIVNDGRATFAFIELYNPGLVQGWRISAKVSGAEKMQQSVLRVKVRLWDIIHRLRKAAEETTTELNAAIAERQGLISETD